MITDHRKNRIRTRQKNTDLKTKLKTESEKMSPVINTNCHGDVTKIKTIFLEIKRFPPSDLSRTGEKLQITGGLPHAL